MQTSIEGNKVVFQGIEYDISVMTNKQLDELLDKVLKREAEIKLRINTFL